MVFVGCPAGTISWMRLIAPGLGVVHALLHDLLLLLSPDLAGRLLEDVGRQPDPRARHRDGLSLLLRPRRAR